jgi:hypothetical protein
MAKTKSKQPRSWKLEPNPTANIRERPPERKTVLETTGSTIRRLIGIKNSVLDRYML